MTPSVRCTLRSRCSTGSRPCSRRARPSDRCQHGRSRRGDAPRAFVGRDGELDRLHAAYRAPSSGAAGARDDPRGRRRREDPAGPRTMGTPRGRAARNRSDGPAVASRTGARHHLLGTRRSAPPAPCGPRARRSRPNRLRAPRLEPARDAVHAVVRCQPRDELIVLRGEAAHFAAARRQHRSGQGTGTGGRESGTRAGSASPPALRGSMRSRRSATASPHADQTESLRRSHRPARA